jgi:molybdopterin converting factor subunit 1
MITVLFFAQARERAGVARASFELSDAARVSDALAAVAKTHPSLEALWPHLAVAVDGVLARPGMTLRDGAELALLPPVSGG